MRRDAARKDDEGRRGSRTAALDAVPSDRQHRLLRGSSARSGFELSLRSFKLRHACLLSLSLSFLLPYSLSLSSLTHFRSLSLSLCLCLNPTVSAWRGRGNRDDDEGKVEPPRVENAGRVQRERIASHVSGSRVCCAQRACTCVKRPACRLLALRVCASSIFVARPKRGGSFLPRWMRDSLYGACVYLLSLSLSLSACVSASTYLFIYLTVYLCSRLLRFSLSLSRSLARSLSVSLHLLSRTLRSLCFSLFPFLSSACPPSYVDLVPLHVVAFASRDPDASQRDVE